MINQKKKTKHGIIMKMREIRDGFPKGDQLGKKKRRKNRKIPGIKKTKGTGENRGTNEDEYQQRQKVNRKLFREPGA